jgi:hypothetical protein
MRMLAIIKECWDSNCEEKQRKRLCLSMTTNDESAVTEKKAFTLLDGFCKAELFQIQSASLLEGILVGVPLVLLLFKHCCWSIVYLVKLHAFCAVYVYIQVNGYQCYINVKQTKCEFYTRRG